MAEWSEMIMKYLKADSKESPSLDLSAKGSLDHNSRKSKTMLKVVIKLPAMIKEKFRAKALKIAVGITGVTSVALNGEERDRLEVTGDGLDPVMLTKLLRKELGAADLISISPVGDKMEVRKEGGGGDDLKNLVKGVAEMGQAGKEETGKERCSGPSKMESLELQLEDVEEPTTSDIVKTEEFEQMEPSVEEELSERERKIKDLKAEAKSMKRRIPEDMEWNVKEIHLMNNKLSILPAHPNCPALVRLFLQGNRNLRVIPTEFFENMPMLQLLDLSYTSIKVLPDSMSKLFSLQEFFLRGCDLLMKLPACIGKLTNLKVFDLEGTELMYPPLVIGEIVNLSCLNMCLYGYANHYLEAKKKGQISRMKLSKLSQLIELSIEVHPEGEWWDDEVKELMNDVYNLKYLGILKLHLPHVGLLEGSICKKLSKFRFIVGHDEPPYESCVPQESEEEFKKWEKSLKHINGADEPAKIAEVLQYANAFFLDRHWTIKKFSEFGIENMKELQFCLLVECNELETIIDGEDKKDESQIVLESLQYLSIHCMKKLESICRGPVGWKHFLFQLKFLALHTCPSLTTIFTLPLLHNLENLEELIIQDCPRIKNLVSPESSDLTSGHFLPGLKKMSFLELPKLDSISSGLCIAPKLEMLVIFCCPMLQLLSRMDISSKDLKAIKGEREWWDTLRWHESDMSKNDQDYLDNRFTKIEMDDCLMTQSTNN